MGGLVRTPLPHTQPAHRGHGVWKAQVAPATVETLEPAPTLPLALSRRHFWALEPVMSLFLGPQE